MAGFIKATISFILFALLLLGINDLIMNIFPNTCEMTYMYQYPEYIEIKVPKYSPLNYTNYKLYTYGEGQYAQSLQKGKFSGIPVLFIPGNAGSYKQVRSLASVAYRMAINRKKKFHFNFFSVDINEDFSGIYGPVLYEQAHFVALSIQTILELYENSPTKPESVILVGHSLGGLVARSVVTLPEIPASYVPLIISLATPHSRPALITDEKMISFYNFVTEYWLHEKSSDLKNVALISIGSGRNDYQISSSLTSYTLADVDTSTLTVPGCWLTTDHQAIVWCRQLVLAITRALFDSIDPKTSLVTTNTPAIVQAFHYQLVLRPGAKYGFPHGFPETLTELDTKGQWSEVIKRQYHLEFQNSEKNNFLMIPLHKSGSQYKHLTIVATEIEWMNWVFACKADTIHKNVKLCSSGINLSQRGRIIPSGHKEVILDVKALMDHGHTHVVVWIHPNENKVTVDLDMNNRKSRSAEVTAPTLFQAMSPLEVKKTPEKALSYNVTIFGLNEVWQSYFLFVESLDCDGKNPIMSFKTSWNRGQWEYHLSSSDPSCYPLEIDVPPIVKNESDHIDVHIMLDPKCTYKISLQGNVIGVFRRMVLFYGNQFLTFCVCHFLIALAYQFKSLGDTSKSHSTFSWLWEMSPIAVVPFVKLSTLLFWKLELVTDPSILGLHGIDMGVLPIVLFLGLLPLSMLTSLIMWAGIILLGKTAHSFATRILGRSLRTSNVITDIAVAGLIRIPVALGIVLASISWATCGSLGLLLATGFYFIKISKWYEDYLEYLLWSLMPGTLESQGQKDYLTSIHIHFTLTILQMLLSLLNFPTLIAWAKNNGPEAGLPSDPSLTSFFISILSLSLIWQCKTFNVNKKYYKALGHTIHACAVLAILFGSITVYRTSYIIGVVMLLVCLHQVFGPLTFKSSQSLGEESRPNTTNLVQESDNEVDEIGMSTDIPYEGASSDSNSFSSDSG